MTTDNHANSQQPTEAASRASEPSTAVGPPEDPDASQTVPPVPLDTPFDDDRPPGPTNPVPPSFPGRRILAEWGIPEGKDGWNDPWRHLRSSQWKAGESGNPRGRPAGSLSYATALKSSAQLPPAAVSFIQNAGRKIGLTDDDMQSMSTNDIIALIHIFHSINGSPQHLRMYIERLDGKIPETINLGGAASDSAAAVRAALAMMDERIGEGDE